jgi:hypothetical protein
MADDRLPPEGVAAWIALAAYVVAWDLYAVRTGRATLSQTYADANRGHTRIPVVLATTFLVLHLQRWPRQLDWIDPLRMAGRHLRK